MLTREDYDKHIDTIKTSLGDDFAKISNVIATLSTDYDSVIQNEKELKNQIENIQNEKVKLLETNNDLFTQIRNNAKEQKDNLSDGTNNSLDVTNNSLDVTNNSSDGTNEKLDIKNIINSNGDLE